MRLAALFLLSTSLLGCLDSATIKTVKNGNLKVCPEKSVEWVVMGFMAKREWESGVSNTGREFVNVKGVMKMDRRTVEVSVKMEPDSGVNTIAYQGMQIDNVPQPERVAMDIFRNVCAK